MNVKLISYTKDPEKVVAAAINQCYSSKTGKELFETMSDEKRGRLIKTVINSGHTSTIEHVSFTFSVEGVSRVTEIQNVRHRIASYSVKSGRYNPSHSDFVVPPMILANKKAMKVVAEFKDKLDEIITKFRELGFKYEDIRYLTPQGTKTNYVMTMNARSLYNFLQHRMCNRAQWEIRTLAYFMHKELMKVAPRIFKFAGPTCKTEGICWEGDLNCGLPDKDKSIEVRSHVK